MSQLETTFYIVGIISFILNIFLLLGVVLGLFFIIRLVLDIRKKVTEKVKVVENIIKHPENAIADLSATIIRRSLKRLREKFSK